MASWIKALPACFFANDKYGPVEAGPQLRECNSSATESNALGRNARLITETKLRLQR